MIQIVDNMHAAALTVFDAYGAGVVKVFPVNVFWLEDPGGYEGEGTLGLTGQLPLSPVLGVDVSEPLDVVEDQPGQRDQHEDHEGDGDKEDRGTLLHVVHAGAGVQPGDVEVVVQQLLEMVKGRQ